MEWLDGRLLSCVERARSFVIASRAKCGLQAAAAVHRSKRWALWRLADCQLRLFGLSAFQCKVVRSSSIAEARTSPSPFATPRSSYGNSDAAGSHNRVRSGARLSWILCSRCSPTCGMTTVASGVPRGSPGPQALNFEGLWRSRAIANPDRLRLELCVRSSEEIPAAVAAVILMTDAVESIWYAISRPQ